MYIKSKMSRALFMIKQVKNILPYKALESLYYTMIHPHILYGILAWGDAPQKYIDGIITTQKRAIRAIHKSKYNSHTEPLFKKSSILKVQDQFIYEVMLFMYEYFNDRLPMSFRSLFNLNINIQQTYVTRQSNLLHIPQVKSKFGAKLPVFNFPYVWNHNEFSKKKPYPLT